VLCCAVLCCAVLCCVILHQQQRLILGYLMLGKWHSLIAYRVHQTAPPCSTLLQATLLNACIIGGCNVAGTVVSLVLADRAGRRGLLLQGGVQVRSICKCSLGPRHRCHPLLPSFEGTATYIC